MRRLLAISVLGATLVVAAPAQANDASASKRRSCGTITSTSIYPYARVIAIRRVSCRGARRLAKRYDRRGTTPDHWRCALAHDDRPRLFSCGSGASSGDLRRWPRALEAVGTRTAPACNSVRYGNRAFVLYYRGLSCASARRKVRHVHRHQSLSGWSCSSGSGFRTGGYCTRGKSYFGWHPGD